jgi:uridylate kinase
VARSRVAFRRVLLKLSGEGLAGPGGFGLGPNQLAYVAKEIRQLYRTGVQVAIVVGGGNILRGGAFAERSAIPEATAHYMGMLATVINGLALQETLESLGMQTRVMSSIPIHAVCEPFVRRRCMAHLEKGRVVILAGGTGRPFFTTDTAAALAAVEIGADALFKATQVDGVYNADPKKNAKAVFYPALSYDRVIDERLAVMDISAVEMCQRNRVAIVVFNLHKPGNLKRAAAGQRVGTIIS